MSQPPTQLAAQLIVPGAGREYTFGQVLVAALRQFRACWGMAIISAVMLVLCYFGLVWTFVIATVILVAVTDASLPVLMVGLGIALLVHVLLFLPLVEGYRWAVVRSFDRNRLLWGEVFQAWKRPWRRPLVSFCLVKALLKAGLSVGLALALGAALENMRLLGPTIQTGLGVVGQALVDSSGILILLPSLLVGPIILGSRRPRFIAATKEHLRILRHQPVRIITVVALPYAVLIAATACIGLAGGTLGGRWGFSVSFKSPTLLLFALAVLLALGVFWVIYQFIIAAVYRAAFGLPLDPHEMDGAAVPFYGVAYGAAAKRKTIARKAGPPRTGDDFDPGAFLPPQQENDTDAPPGEVDP